MGFDLQRDTVEWLIRLAGAGQLALALGSLAVPRALGWSGQLAGNRPLLRSVFWTYAAYIFGAHLFFAALSIFGAPLLADGSMLAAIVCAFIALWWAARLVIQFAFFDRNDAPFGPLFRLGEIALVFAFVAFAFGYLAAAIFNLTVK